MPIGQLVVELIASQAKFIEGLNAATAHTEASAHRIESALSGAFSRISSLAATLGVTLSVAGITAWGASVVEAAEHLRNLSVTTGSSVEELSRLANITKVSGESFDKLQTMIDRLAAGLGGAEGKSTRIAEALKVLGVNAKDPATALQQVADKLAKFADGANKAALAKDLFGRGGVEFLAVLKAIAEQSGIAATRTTEQAEKAAQLAESYRRLTVESTALSAALLDAVVPSLSKLVTTMSDAIRISGGFAAGLGNLATLNPFGAAGDNIKRIQADVDKLREKIANPTFLGLKVGGGTDALERDLARQLKVLEIAKAQQIRELGLIDNAANYDARDIRARQRPDAPKLPPRGTGGAVDDPTRKILEAALAALKANSEQEKAVLANREQYLQAAFERGDVSIADYYAGKQAAQDEDLRRTSANYLAEIALIDDYIAHAKTATDRAQGEKDRIAATARENLAVTQAAGKAQQALDEQSAAFRRAATDAISANFDRVANLTARADLAQQTGGASELQTLAAKSEAATKYVDILRTEIAAQEVLAQQSLDPKAMLAVEQLKLRLDQLAATTHLVADALDKINTDALATFLDDIVHRTKTVSQAVRDMGTSIERSISKLIEDDLAKKLYKSLFGDGGVTGGVSPGSWLAALLGLGGSAAGTGGGIGYGTAGSLIPEGPFPYASGGDPLIGKVAMVGERGPELFVPKTAGTIIPNDVLMARRGARQLTVNNHFTISGPVDRRTQDQIAASAAQALHRASRIL